MLRLERNRGGTQADKEARGEGAAGIGGILGVTGAVAGGIGAYYLHRALFRDRAPATWTAMVQPVIAQHEVALSVGGSF